MYKKAIDMNDQHCGPTISGDIVVIGGGSAGIGLLASLLKRDPQLNITLIEPSEYHCTAAPTPS